MQLSKVLEIVERVLSVAKTQTSGKIHEDAVLADNILQIIKIAVDEGTAQAAPSAGSAPSQITGDLNQ